MTWTFDESMASDKDKVRSLIGDIDPNNPLLSDEIVDGQLTWRGSVYTAAVECLAVLEAKFAQFTESRAGEGLTDKTAVSNKFKDLRRRLLKVGRSGYAVLLTSQKETYNEDTDRMTTSITRGGFDAT